MVWATLYLSGKDWLWPATGLLCGALLLLFWSYRNSHLTGGLRVVCVVLKTAGLLALAACLIEPLWTSQRAKPGANLFVVLADNSQGLTIRDLNQPAPRGDLLRSWLHARPGDWQSALESHFQVRRYLFDSRLQHTRDFSELDFSGRLSALNASLRQIARRFEGRPLAGLLLFTDGNATDLGDAILDPAGLPPVYPVLAGTGQVGRDLAITKVTVSQTSFEDAPITVQAEVRASGFEGRDVVAELHAIPSPAAHATPTAPPHAPAAPAESSSTLPTQPAAESPAGPGIDSGASAARPDPEKAGPDSAVQSHSERAGHSEDTLSYRFQFRASQPGVNFYQLRVAARGAGHDLAPEAGGVGTGPEATEANNSRVMVVDRGRGPYRILYVGGRPNWEYKFLNRALIEDDQVQLVGLIRIARREPKFEFKGRQGDASNPLFRGFDGKTEETEQYDQPVLIRINTRDALELAGGFPKTEEDLFAYHALILDDVEAAFFTGDQLSLIHRFVVERGGGFLMLGGPDSFRSGQFERTPVANLLPVYLDAPELARAPGALQLELTREGMLEPWIRLRPTEPEERSRLADLPGYLSLNRVEHLKPGAVALAKVTDRSQQDYPALAAQRFGHGRAAALLVGDLWRAGMKEPALQEDLGKTWRQTIRWLVADVPERLAIVIQPQHDDPNQAVLIQARVRTKQFRPLDNASVQFKVAFAGPAEDASSPIAGAPLQLTAEPSPAEAGLYEALFVPRETGAYWVEATAKDPDGVEVATAQAGWASEAAAEEFRSLQPNPALLEALAKSTGGRMLRPQELGEFAESLPSLEAPVQEVHSRPLWHQAGVFLFALACFIAEWGVRRWKGLA